MVATRKGDREPEGWGEMEGRREGGRGRERAYFEMVILVPDSAIILLRVLPPFPAERDQEQNSSIIRDLLLSSILSDLMKISYN